MKKNLFLLSAAAAMVTAATAFTSCSNDELEGANSSREAISFATKGNTRVGTTVTALNEFTATALLVDNSVLFKDKVYQYQNGTFTSAEMFYWPQRGVLSFCAINVPGERTSSRNNYPKYTYSKWNGEQDLVAAYIKNCEKVSPVQLEFKHITSQITVSAEPKDKAEELTYKVNSIKMEAPSTGTFTFWDTDGELGSKSFYWDINNSSTSEYVFVNNTKSFNQSGNYTNNDVYWNILPTSSGSLKFTVDYQVYANNRLVADYTGKKCKVCTVENPSLVAGTKYNYNLVLPHNLDPMSFTYSMEDWNGGENIDNEVSAETRAESTFVDLGLPSGVKWAAGNIGAEKETDDAGSYRYDNINNKRVFDYLYYNETDALKDIAAGRIPTETEFRELVNNCNVQSCSNYKNSNVDGVLFTSKINGKSIFFPFCMYYDTVAGYWKMEDSIYSLIKGEDEFSYNTINKKFSFGSTLRFDLDGTTVHNYYPARAVTK